MAKSKKPALTFKKPPPATPAEADGFVARGRAVKTASGLDGKKSERQQTVYLPPDLKQRLHLHSVQRKQTVSEVVQEAIARLLAG